MELTVEQILREGVTAHKIGELSRAKRCYEAILRVQPTHPDSNYYLGLLAVSQGKHEESLLFLKAALESSPSKEQYWLSFIEVLIRTNRFENAREAIKQASSQGVSQQKLFSLESLLSDSSEALVQTSPTLKQLEVLLHYYQTECFSEAESLALSITEQFPKHPFAWKVLGNLFSLAERFPESLAANQKALELDPLDAEAFNNRGNALQSMGRLNEAEASYRQSIEINPNYPQAHNNLGNVYEKRCKYKDAEACYKRAVLLKPNYPKAHTNLGNVYREQALLEEAETSLKEAINLQPDFALAHYNLGRLNLDKGRIERAESCLKKAIALEPDHAEAHLDLTKLKKFKSEDEQYLAMKSLYSDGNLTKERRCYICFGLAKACEDMKRYERAFRYYNEGNILRKELLGYDIAQDKERFKQLKSTYPSLAKSALTVENLGHSPVPIFIIGMPRSGTSLVEQIISSHSLVTGAGELPFAEQFGGALAQGISSISKEAVFGFRNRYLMELQNRSGGNPIVTDKMPHNFCYVGLIAAAFPEAKIVHVKRDPKAVCWANYKQIFDSKSLGYCCDIDDVVNYFGLYSDLMAFWRSTLSHRIYEVDYEQLTVRQEEETRQLMRYLGLDWEQKCLSPQENERSVATASNVQVREKVYQGSSQQWKKYEPYLEGAFDNLDDSFRTR